MPLSFYEEYDSWNLSEKHILKKDNYSCLTDGLK